MVGAAGGEVVGLARVIELERRQRGGHRRTGGVYLLQLHELAAQRQRRGVGVPGQPHERDLGTNRIEH